MDFITTGHRHGDFLFSNLPEYTPYWNEICDALHAIGEDEIVSAFEASHRRAKSISQVLNQLIKRELVARGWKSESPIFADEEFAAEETGIWRVDFAKKELSVEVAFNHRSDIAWNLIKPTLASELNHVEKAIQTAGGVIVAATRDMKAAGGFDSAIGTYEDYVQYLKPLRTLLTAPMIVVGLEAPKTFRVEHDTVVDPTTGRRQNIGRIRAL